MVQEPNASEQLFAGFLVPFQHIANRIDVMEAYGAGAASYMGYPGMRTLVAPQDPLTPSLSGYHSNKYISLWDNGDRMNTDAVSYERGLKAMRPEAFVALCDADTPKPPPPSDDKAKGEAVSKAVRTSGSNKRLSKAVKKSLELLDATLTNYSLRQPFLFASVQGGYDMKARRASVNQVAKRTGVDGYFLDGFHLNHTDSNREGIMEEMRPLLAEVLSALPREAPKLYHGFCTPVNVVELVLMGVDMFESSFPIYLAENGQAFVFPNKFPAAEIEGGNSQAEGESAKDDGHWIDLKESECYKNDFTPIVESCSCYTCRNHTKAYINHLLMTKELLAPVLLTIHNLHYYGTFFKSVRSAISAGKLDVLRGVLAQTQRRTSKKAS